MCRSRPYRAHTALDVAVVTAMRAGQMAELAVSSASGSNLAIDLLIGAVRAADRLGHAADNHPAPVFPASPSVVEWLGQDAQRVADHVAMGRCHLRDASLGVHHGRLREAAVCARAAAVAFREAYEARHVVGREMALA